ncbi:MAG: protein-disulfide reductase DsbD domain-containing protein, partial [Planctomycetota bacterium]
MPSTRTFRPSLSALLTVGVAALVGVVAHQAAGVAKSISDRNASTHAIPVAFAQDGSKLVKVQAVAEKTHLVAGETNWIGMVFNVSRGWHIYWRNPGTGMPTSWKLKDAPDGVRLGDAVWPTPERYETQFGVDFVHHGRAFIMIPVEVDASVANLDEVTLEIEASWLVCKEICVPGNGTASLTLPVAKSAGDAEDARAARAFKRARD